MNELPAKVAQARRRRQPTQRGVQVINAVTGTAARLLQERFVDQISLVELAKESRVARASLLLQFPGGWPDILSTVAITEVNLDTALDEALAQDDLIRSQQVFIVLNSLLNRAEKSGLLFANMRGAMFSWGAENQGVYRIALEACWEVLRVLMANETRSDELEDRRLAYLAEGLLNLTLDLASSEGYMARTWDERRAALRVAVDASLASTAPKRSK